MTFLDICVNGLEGSIKVQKEERCMSKRLVSLFFVPKSKVKMMAILEPELFVGIDSAFQWNVEQTNPNLSQMSVQSMRLTLLSTKCKKVNSNKIKLFLTCVCISKELMDWGSELIQL